MTTSLENLGQGLARLSSNLDERSKQLSGQAGRIDEIRSELLRTQALAQSSGASSQLLLRLQRKVAVITLANQAPDPPAQQ
jgi:hypothetical protein